MAVPETVNVLIDVSPFILATFIIASLVPVTPPKLEPSILIKSPTVYPAVPPFEAVPLFVKVSTPLAGDVKALI